MGREEQREEREVVLGSIYPDEIQDISETEYRISIALEVKNENGDDTPAPTIILNVRYPEAYPDEAPDLDITQPPNSQKHPFLDVKDDKASLLEGLQPTIEDSIGMAMIYTLVTSLKDAAESLISERQQALQTQKDLESQRAEEEENRKFEGEKVTKESFLAWRAAFQKEMDEQKAKLTAELEAEERKKRGGKLEEKRLTGRQLWEQGLTGKTADEDEDGEDAVEAMRTLKVDA